jgi:23S rRNA pseudouridine2604 synthase
VLVRLNKFISDAGVCSRREADRKIENGKVRVNGRQASVGDLVSHADKVMVDGNIIEMRSEHVYLAYNKPMGITSTTDRTDPDNILRALAYHGGRVFPVGRLDKDSEGLILLTDDGDIVNKILRASNKHDKEYLVSVDKPITPDFTRQMAEGVSILGVMTRRCTVDKINTHTFRIILTQGMNRQIRRMSKALGYTVTRLQRVRVMHIRVDGIAPGTWRFLTESETETLLKAVRGSRKDAARSKEKSDSGWDESQDDKPKRKTAVNPRARRLAKSASKRFEKSDGPRQSSPSASNTGNVLRKKSDNPRTKRSDTVESAGKKETRKAGTSQEIRTGGRKTSASAGAAGGRSKAPASGSGAAGGRSKAPASGSGAAGGRSKAPASGSGAAGGRKPVRGGADAAIKKQFPNKSASASAPRKTERGPNKKKTSPRQR